MLARRVGKQSGGAGSKRRQARGIGKAEIPTIEDFVSKQDFSGALAVLDFKRRSGEVDETTLHWIAYCAWHLGDYERALETYDELLAMTDRPILNVYRATCLLYLGRLEEASEAAHKGDGGKLQVRLLFQLAQRQGDEAALTSYHAQLEDVKLDQLCLAAAHYHRAHFDEARLVYKALLLDHRNDAALNVYIAMCYYKMDYYDVSLELLGVYTQKYPESIVALNVKACNHFRLYNGKAAEAELKPLKDAGVNLDDVDLLQHNLVVFRNGANALRVLPQLVHHIPEAKLNLVIYYLKNGHLQEAFDRIQDMQPQVPHEYILKAVVLAALGQATDNKEFLASAAQLYRLVGDSPTECDTIPGRQCMASCFFLQKQFDDVHMFLDSIKAYLYMDDNFNWNFGITCAASGNYKEGEEALLLVQSDKMQREYTFLSWLARCYIMNGKAKQAWELYLKMDTSADSLNLLRLIANDCYKMGAFYFAAKAFDVLERLDSEPEYWEGKRGACMGVFQLVIAGKLGKEVLADVMSMLRNTTNPQTEFFVSVIKQWCAANGVAV
ncbi:TTC26 [Symbiodinium sp. KB8]|nr:TTC26 [Symbiodinium sp. KB8]